MLKVLGKKQILELLKEKYPNAEHIELYVDYRDENVEGNDQIIAEINLREHLDADELLGIFDKPNDNGEFVLDMKQAREERAEDILNKKKD